MEVPARLWPEVSPLPPEVPMNDSAMMPWCLLLGACLFLALTWFAMGADRGRK